MVLAGKNIQIKTIQDFDNLRLGHLEGLKYSKDFYDYVEARRKKGSLIIATTENSCLKMLLNNMIDVFVDTQDTALWQAKEMNDLLWGYISTADGDCHGDKAPAMAHALCCLFESRTAVMLRLLESLCEQTDAAERRPKKSDVADLKPASRV